MILAETGQGLCNILNRVGMTRNQLAEFSGLTTKSIEDLEETDYHGSWAEAIVKINKAFRKWFQT